MKKGSTSILFTIAEVVAVIFIVSMMVVIARSFGSGEAVVKANTANDFMLMINTLVGVPGDALVEYPLNMSEHILVLSSGQVLVFRRSDPDQQKAIRNFYLPQDYFASGAVEEKARICLEKKYKNILLRECT